MCAMMGARSSAKLMRGEPTLLLFHIDLLRHADGVLCVGFRHGAVIDRLILQRAHLFAEMENMRRLCLLGSVLRRNPVHDILTRGVVRVLRRRSDSGRIPGYILRLSGDLG